MNRELRNVHIGFAVGVVVAVVGVYLLRDAGEDALQGVGVAMFAAMFGTFFFLDARDERRRKRDQ